MATQDSEMEKKFIPIELNGTLNLYLRWEKDFQGIQYSDFINDTLQVIEKYFPIQAWRT